MAIRGQALYVPNYPPDSVKLPTLKGGAVVEEQSRLERKRKERRSKREKARNQGVATLRAIADLGRAFSFLASLWDRWNF